MAERTSSPNRIAELALRLLDILKEIADDNASVKNVHNLRTTVRRLEVAVTDTQLGSKKLDKQLTTLRRRAGSVRDADVQLEMLNSLRHSGQQGVDELSAWLRLRRNKQEARLTASVTKSEASGLRKRIERLKKKSEKQGEMPRPSCAEALQAVRERYLALSTTIPAGGDALHDFRKSCKTLRYELEPVPDTCAQRLVSKLKQVQDAIGEWHDWEELALHAEHNLRRRSFPLLAMLHSRARSSCNEARRSAADLREELLTSSNTRKPVLGVSMPTIKSVAR